MAARKGGPRVEKMKVEVFHEEAAKIIGGMDTAGLPKSRPGLAMDWQVTILPVSQQRCMYGWGVNRC